MISDEVSSPVSSVSARSILTTYSELGVIGSDKLTIISDSASPFVHGTSCAPLNTFTPVVETKSGSIAGGNDTITGEVCLISIPFSG